MTEQKTEHIDPKKSWSRFWKWLLIPLLILMLLVSVRAFLQSNWLMEQIRQVAEEQASANLNGTLRIGHLEGDLLFGLRFSDLELIDENGKTLLTAAELGLRYTIPSLVFQPYRVDVLSADQLEVYGEQFEDGSWNLLQLLPEPEPDADPEPTEMPLWHIHRLEIARSSASVISPQLPDGSIRVTGLQFYGSAGFLEAGWLGTVNELEFKIEEERLLQPVEVDAVASLVEGQFTLEHLLVNTGRTVARSRLFADDQERIEGALALNPLSWLDLDAYADQPFKQDVTAQLIAGGSLDDLYLQLDLSANGLESMNLAGRVHLKENPSLSELSLSLSNFDGPVLTGDTLAPYIRSARLDSEGRLFFNALDESRFAGELSVEGVTLDEYGLDRFSLLANLEGQNAGVDFTIEQAGQFIEGEANFRNLFEELPQWTFAMSGDRLNFAELLGDTALQSELNMNVTAGGRGFELSDEYFDVNLELLDSRWGEQPLDQIHFEGRVSADELTGIAGLVIGGSRVSSDFYISSWQAEPSYRFTAGFEAFNTADFTGLEEFPTHINATVEGEGKQFDLEALELLATMEFDSSVVNGEPIDHFQAVLEIRDQVATLSEAELISPIANATLFVRQHLLDLREPENTLDFDLTIKDINPLSPLFGLDSLKAAGTFNGRLFRQANGNLQFDSQTELDGIVYDTLFTIESVRGEATVRLLEDPEFDIDVEVDRPGTDGFTLQSIHLESSSVLIDSLFTGNLQISFLQDDENAIHHASTFEYLDGDLLYTTTHFTFHTPDRALDLQRDFELTLRDGIVEMDTLHIQSPDGMAFLKVVIPWLDENRQEVTLEASLLDLGTLQRSFLDDFYAEALLSGRAEIYHNNGLIRTDTDLKFSEIEVNGGEIDSLNIALDIDEGRMLTNAGAWHNGSELLYLRGDLPFEPGDPLEFDEEFFEKNVEAEFRLNSSPVVYWMQLLGVENDRDLDGNISFRSEVQGTAGYPLFNGRFELAEGNLSGVRLDSMGVDIQYIHEDATVRFDGSVHSLGSQIASFESVLPFYLDLQAFRVDLPGDEDEVYVSFNSDNLNIALFNEFLDRNMFRGLEGRLSANLELQGTVADLESQGSVSLRNGSVRLVQNNITLQNIRTDINLTRDRIQLANFTMNSGPGNFTANGSVEMDGLEPGNVDLNMRANVFRISNTPDFNAIVDLQSRITGNYQRPELTGRLGIRSGFIFLQNFGEQAVEDVQLDDEPEPMNIAIYDSMSIEMTVAFDRQFFVRNRQFPDMEIELAGEVDLVKQSGGELEMFGGIEGVRGHAQTLGRNFQLENAMITFSGPIENPDLNVRTLYEPPQTSEDIRIWYIIEGNVENPEFRFESEPFLELQDIISYTVFGQPFHALDSWQQAISGGGSRGGAADIALDLLMDRVEMLAAQQLGIDVVQIDTNRSSAGSSTTIKTGWFIGDRTFFAVLNEISGVTPKTLFMLEYMIRRNLELIVTQGDDSREGIDIRWQYDY